MKTQKAKADREKAIIVLRQQNKSMSEIATELNVRQEVVSYVCKKYGMGGRMSNKRADYAKVKETVNATYKLKMEKYAVEMVKKCGEFEYIGGYTGHDGVAVVRCLKCGNIFEAHFQAIRKKQSIKCPKCTAKQIAEQNALLKATREAERIERMMASWRNKIAKAKQKERAREKHLHLCPICGKPTYDKGCCSAKCQKTYANRTHDQKRRARLHDAIVDGDIQLMELYRRDGGVCWLCGEQCDINDQWLDEYGNTITGNSYPSIDHVIPLSKGGAHSWDNVRLAHQHCNTVKSNKIISPISQKIDKC